MSYEKRYKEKITIPYSGKVEYTYPASEKGGTTKVSYSGVVREDIVINIKVDTKKFDVSIEDCNDDVDVLTGAVVAAESAQIAAVKKNSKKIANTIITGFFSYVRSEISQQISELTQSCEAHLLYARDLIRAIIGKKRQIENDFHLISSRYLKIFNDLNDELTNRILGLDKSAFLFKKELDDHFLRLTNSAMVSTVLVVGRESCELESKIHISTIKKRSFDALNKAKNYLLYQKKFKDTLQYCILTENKESCQYLPVCFLEVLKDEYQTTRKVYASSYVKDLHTGHVQSELISHFVKAPHLWRSMSQSDINNIEFYFNLEVNQAYSAADQHSMRVKEMIHKIADIDSIKTINNNIY